ncbi:T9SS C-terminal target domain-containing protein [Paludibacter sp. 221]|uniref:T9SS type A sorting domain-containing protein n=1 Tax=Paludibacter sp. 221 TaxID=2302939 RepID=UPI0013D206CA|nr:T9SS type A sorting domain-containing protein [Paludibacter sp. 221]NDV47142.1 T9SS C-terminal target domain-containing protein [Paludibacter sp. 221]
MRSFLFFLIISVFSFSAFSQQKYYVKSNGSDTSMPGTSWAHAFKSIDKALLSAQAGDTVFVAAGTYRQDFFRMKEGVQVYGGFSGTGEGSYASQVDTLNYKTILYGKARNWSYRAERVFEQPDNFAHKTEWAGFRITLDPSAKHSGGGVRLRQNGVLRLCTVHGNLINESTEFVKGAGVYIGIGALLVDCMVTNNKMTNSGTSEGAGVYNEGEMINCIVSGNTMPNNGGDKYGCGVFNESTGRISNCIIANNKMSGHLMHGIGIYNCTGGVVESCQISNNTLGNPTGWYTTLLGGGAYNMGVLKNCHIESNMANAGGGVYMEGAGSVVRECVIRNNSTETKNGSHGGGVYIAGGEVLNCEVSLNNAKMNGGGIYLHAAAKAINCLVTHNKSKEKNRGDGNGVYVNHPQAEVINCTVLNNMEGTKSGVYNNGQLINSIVWGHGSNIAGSGSFSYSLVQGNSSTADYNVDTSTMDANDIFLDYDNEEYRLKRISPAANRGDNVANATSTDLAGMPRIIDKQIDLGAYESANCWMGGEDSLWNNPNNWTANEVIRYDDDLIFHVDAQRNCYLSDGQAKTVHNILNPTAKLIHLVDAELVITGQVSEIATANIHSARSANNEPGTVSFGGAETQTIYPGTFDGNGVGIFHLNKTQESAYVVLKSDLIITDSIKHTQGYVDALTHKPAITLFNTVSPELFFSGKPFIDTSVYDFSIMNTGLVYHTDSLTVANGLTISANSTFALLPSTFLKVKLLQNFADEDGLLIKADPGRQKPNPTLIFHNECARDASPHESSSQEVRATVEMYTRSSYNPEAPEGSRFKWQFVGIPLTELTGLMPTFNNCWIRSFNEPAMREEDLWLELGENGRLEPFKGYELVSKNPENPILYKGVLENNDFEGNPLTETSGALYSGQHLYANPYMAAIPISSLTTPDGAVYLFNTGSYNEWEEWGSGSPEYTGEFHSGKYIAVPVNQAGQNGLPRNIPSMQGFLIKTLPVLLRSQRSSGNLYVDYDNVVKNIAVRRSAEENKEAKISTLITLKGKSLYDKLWIFTEDSCSHSFDFGWDAEKLISSSPYSSHIYVAGKDADLQVSSVDTIGTIGLGFKPGISDTDYTLVFEHENAELRYSAIYLVDLEKRIVIDVTRSGSEYTFATDNYKSASKRFLLMTNLIDADVQTPAISISTYNKNILIENNTNASGEIALYDLSGRFLCQQSLSANRTELVSADLYTGVYIVKVSAGNEEVTQRVVISN